MIRKRERRLRVGVLGCGPIAQFAHFESCIKARNADLYAICDVAADLRRAHGARPMRRRKPIADYDAMLADPELEAVIVATSDAFHVPMRRSGRWRPASMCCAKSRSASRSRRSRSCAAAVEALGQGAAGRPHEALRSRRSRRPAISSRDEMGEMLALKAWYCDSTHRYTMTDAVQPLPVTSAGAKKPRGQSQGRSAPLFHAGAWQPSRRHGALPVRRDRRGAARGSPSSSAPIAGSSTSNSPMARSAIST